MSSVLKLVFVGQYTASAFQYHSGWFVRKQSLIWSFLECLEDTGRFAIFCRMSLHYVLVLAFQLHTMCIIQKESYYPASLVARFGLSWIPNSNNRIERMPLALRDWFAGGFNVLDTGTAMIMWKLDWIVNLIWVQNTLRHAHFNCSMVAYEGKITERSYSLPAGRSVGLG